jgi:hypothetical protein
MNNFIRIKFRLPSLLFTPKTLEYSSKRCNPARSFQGTQGHRSKRRTVIGASYDSEESGFSERYMHATREERLILREEKRKDLRWKRV